ncbi:ABC transporter ATP-binding protein/permease, partial [Burkholderia glumae]
MTMNRAFPADRAEDREARRHFPTVWKLIQPYWVTREGVLSALMLVYVLGAGWANTYIAIWLNRWTGIFYDAVGSSRFQTLPHLLLQFLLVSMAGAAVTISTGILLSIVEIRWRRWLTTWLAEQWLARHTYYRIERDRALENIDQRIAEDAKLFVKDTLLLSMNALHVPVSIVSFSVI